MDATNDIVARVRADLQRAQLSAEKARAALAAAETQVSELTIFLRTLERYAGDSGGGASTLSAPEHDRNRRFTTVPARGTNSRTLVDACMAAIAQAGRPLTIGELVDVCVGQGLKIGGRDLKSNLAGYLSRDPRVESLGRGVGWAIVENDAPDSTSGGEDASFVQSSDVLDRQNLQISVDSTIF